MMRFALAALAFFVVQGSFAQSYPAKPVTMVVGFAPGGGTDTVSRIIAKTLGENLGQQVIVDNKAGAGGNIAADHVARAAPDGYTLLLGNVGSLAVAPHLVARLSFDPLRDLAPVTMAVVFANVIVVHPSIPANTLAEFVTLAKAKPDQLTYGSSGIGGAGHLAGELLKMMANIDIVHVPYKGGGPAMQGLLGGQISAYFATPVAAGPHIRAGKARALATTGATRSKLMPDMPTVAESGYPGYEATNWYAYVVPAKTPPAIIERLSRELGKVLATPEVVDLLHKQGVEPQPGTPQELGRFIQREYQTWGKVVKEAKIQAN